MANLTRGVIQKLFHKVHKKSDGPVLLQVTAVKTVGASGNVRVKVSDGLYENQMCMYAGEKETLPPFSIMKLTSWNFTNSAVPEKAILQIEGFEIVKQPEEVQNKKIGNPTVWKYSGGELKMETNFPKSENKENKPAPEGGRYMAIQALTPYMNKWTIKGRVTQKGDMREWNNARGSGKLFSFTIADETSDLKVTSFKEDAEKFIDVITKGKIYQITNGSLKAKNAKFNQTEHDYELTLGRNTVINELEDDDEIPTIRYNFIKINELEKKEKWANADILGIVKAADESVTMIMIKSRNEESPKRTLTLVDDSMATVMCTLWGDNALNFDASNIGKVVALKDSVVGDYGGRSLSLGRAGEIFYDYQGDGASKIQNWWGHASNDTFSSLSSQGAGGGRVDSFVTLSTVLNGENYQGDKPYYLTSKGLVTFVKRDNVLYKACPGKDGGECKKKLIDEGNGNYRCEKCDFSTPNFVYRMILNAQVGDSTHSVWMTFFAEQGEEVLSIASADLGLQIENVDSADFDTTLNKALFKEYIIGARSRIEMYQDEQKKRVTCSKIAPVDYVKYGNQLCDTAVAGGHLNL